MYADSTLARFACGAAVWALVIVPAVARADEIAGGDGGTRSVTAKRQASREAAELRVEFTAVERQGKLAGSGRLFFRWASPGKGGDVESEINETVRVEGSLQGDDVRLQIVGPKQLKYVVKKAPPPDPTVPLKDQVHVGSTGQWPLTLFDPWNDFEGRLVNGHYEQKGPQTMPSGEWMVATEMRLTQPALVERLTIGGRVESGDVFRVAFGEADVSISVNQPGPEAAAAQLAAAWNGNEAARSWGITAVANGGDVWLTVHNPQHAFSSTIDTTEADGGLSDGQTFASATQYVAGGPAAALWKKEIRHCGRLLATLYAAEPSPAVGAYQSFRCPVCGMTASGGEWSPVKR